jgi:hypothetical protein
MAGNLDFLPRRQAGVDLDQQLVGLFLELEDLLLQVDVPVGGEQRKLLDLFLQLGDRFFKIQVFRRQIVLLSGP